MDLKEMRQNYINEGYDFLDAIYQSMTRYTFS